MNQSASGLWNIRMSKTLLRSKHWKRYEFILLHDKLKTSRIWNLKYSCLEDRRYYSNVHDPSGPLLDHSKYFTRAYWRFWPRVWYIYPFLKIRIYFRKKILWEWIQVPSISVIAHFGFQCRRWSARTVVEIVFISILSFQSKGWTAVRKDTNYLTIESTYVIRRVELHNRQMAEGQPPWSIRQTGVYHRHRLTYDSNPSPFTAFRTKCSKSAFLLISPSKSIESRISKCLDGATSNREELSPWAVHLLLIAESQEGWMDYMAWLEASLKEQVSSALSPSRV